MALTDDNESLVIGAIINIAEEIKLETMKHPKGSLYEPHRAQINGITRAYVELAKKILDRQSAETLIHFLYFEFEKPVSEYLGFRMSSRLPNDYMII